MAGSQKLDARQIRSKNALFSALDAMLGERKYAEITIIDLVERAGIGRQTFYRHFDSIDAMLEERLRTDLAEQMAVARTAMRADEGWAWSARLAAFAFERAGKNPGLYRLILGGEAGDRALRLFRAQIGNMLALSPTLPKPSAGLDANAQFPESFYAGGISALLLRWLETENPPSPEKMGELFVQLIRGSGQEA